MAEQKKTKKPATAKAPSRVTVTNREDTDKPRASKSGAKSSSAKGGKDVKSSKQPTGGKKTTDSDGSERKLNFMRNFMPYILGSIALFLTVCFIVDAFSRDIESPSDHGMDVVGYYLCRVLFGLLSWVAYLIPAVLVTLTVFWQRYFRTGRVIGKLILSICLLLLLAAFTHVIACSVNAELDGVLKPNVLFEAGASFSGGGVLGGLLGFLLGFLGLPGAIVITIILLPLIIMCLVGVTPRQVFEKLWSMIRGTDEQREQQKERRAERRAERRDTRRDDSDDNENIRKERRSPSKEELDEEDQASEDETDDADEDVIRVHSKTGEVIEDAPSHGKRDKRAEKQRGRKKSSEEDAEEDFSSLPLMDAHADKEASPADDDRHEQASLAEDVPWDASDAPPPVSIVEHRRYAEQAETLSLYEDEESEDGDCMEVGFDDDPDSYAEDTSDMENEFIPTRLSGRRTSYEVVTDSEIAAGHRAGEPVSVRILKSDTSAVAERGLSDEEIVLPSGSEPEVEEIAEAREYLFPSADMLTRGPSQYATNDAEIAENTQILRDVLESFRIGVREIECSCGPTITRFEVKPDTGVRVRSIANLVDDIAMGLAKAGVRIEAPIPGKSAVGIEVPNAEPSTVYLRNILETPEFRNHKSRIAACLGADVSGRPVILDINKMPHLLIAGATGTGKSVCINSLIMSILYKAKPDEVKLILIDPKKVEFAMYRDLPHLYAPVVSDPKKAAGALNSAVNEMERRFELIEEVGVRNLAGYNEITAGDPERPPLPQMVIIIDELADLMMTAPAEVETAICRLAQKARAAGIHLVIGTQRPSVDVITGLIKANVPSRIAFTVKSGVDSRTILDTVGADKLIGRGDMLYAPIGSSKPMRVQGAFVSESEVEKVVTFIKEHNDPPEYNEDFARSIDLEAAKCGSKKKGEQMSLDDFDGIGGGGRSDGEDPKFWEALEIAVTKDKIGTSALQRACNLGYGRAAKIIDRMEELGFVGPDPGTKQGRKVIISKQDLIQYKLNGLPTGDGKDDADEP